MGVPKFFRYISERYPCLSEVVREYQIPEFDNLYLDMNGIIHMCSHPDDDNVHFRITEEQIFKDIFHYIEVLFRMIKPQKIFFMAVDGVAPRAKMNQQRGRRFRSAKDADKREKDAEKKGEVLPDAARFDSNCITPGTVFMARLHEQLKYFVIDKISNDALWQNCTIILSGHETPGEGEHKIMDYIRYMRAQPGYNPNTRHCLYGLDADLIMLGLCSHEPRFSLLREEVKFGRKSTKRVSVPEETTFFLLHLSLMREYLELEFSALKDSLKTFQFDIEKIIDDWVLMGFLVGNDFIPHLPNLHIVNGALPFLYKAYMEVLPTLDGYINENGDLNLLRFEKFMQKLSGFDLSNFEEIRDDLLYMEAKTGRKQTAHSKVSSKPSEQDSVDTESEPQCTQGTQRDSGLAALIQAADDFAESLDEDEEEEYTDLSEDEAFTNYKREYYQNKLEFAKVTTEIMRAQAEGYVRAIQWNLNYYYKGCCSWSWYYPHHYAPYISDIKGFSNLDLQFDFGRPFLPFEQLLAVLPPASKNLLPLCYHDLMTKENSMIKKYYPDDFETDLNGKKQEWEAVVLVPFIDENLLLEAMSYCNDKLTTEEARRNTHGPMLIYTYTARDNGVYNAPEYFPPVIHNHTMLVTMSYDDVLIPRSKLVKGVHPEAQMNIYYPGFPTMQHLKYKAELKIANIKVFDYASRGENMVIYVTPSNKIASGEMIPVDLLGSTVFVKWPHLTEAKVVAISNSKRKYINMGQSQYHAVEQVAATFKSEIDGITEYYQKRMGIYVGETKVLVYVQTLMGKKYSINTDGKLNLEKQFTTNVSSYPLQVVVYNIKSFDGCQNVGKEIEHIFPKNCICFTLTNPYYGARGVVQENLFKKNGRLRITVTVEEEPDFQVVEECRQKFSKSYRTLHSLSRQLAIPHNMFSRITGSIFIKVPGPEGTSKNVNIGLDLKMNKKNLEIPGYTKKIGSVWHYSDKAAELVESYCENFPEVFGYLSGDLTFEDINPEHMFGENWEERLDQLKGWLKSLPSYGMERRICGSIVLEPEIVAEIEKAVDSFKMNKIKNVTMQIKPTFLYRPEIQTGTLIPDPKMDIRMMDRVVNVRCGYSVPFALKGTVISIQESLTDSDRDTMYEILFDSPFKGGMKFNCSSERIYKLPKYSFINISYGKRLMEQKTGKPDDVIAASQNVKFGNQFDFPQSSSQFQNSSQQFGNPNSAFALFSSSNPSRQLLEQKDNMGTHMQNLQNIQSHDSFNNAGSFRTQNDNFKYYPPQRNPAKLDESPVRNYKKNDRDAVFNSNSKPEARVKKEWEKSEADTSKNWRSNRTPNNESQKRPQVNVDILKNLLKINGNDKQQSTSNVFSEQNKSDNQREPVSIKKETSETNLNKTEVRKESRASDEEISKSQVADDFLKNILKLNVTDEQPVSTNTSSRENESQDFRGSISNNDIVQGNKTVDKIEEGKVTSVSFDQLSRPLAADDILKNILKLNVNDEKLVLSNTSSRENESHDSRGSILNEDIVHGKKTVSKTEEKKVTSVSFDQLSQVANASASIRLLTYYQSNGLGLPRYQYVKCPEGQQAQIILSDGKLIVGRPAVTREQASENVAEEVLNLFVKNKKKSDNCSIKEDFPAPPQTWFQSEKNSTEPNKVSASKGKTDTSKLLNNSFVPLQAIKSHITKTNKYKAEDQKENVENLVSESETRINATKGTNNTNIGQNKPKKERKTRIAANFNKK